MVIRNYYQLYELANVEGANNPLWAKINNKSMYDLLSPWITVGTQTITPQEYEFFQKYLYPKFWEHIFSYVDKEGWYIETIPDPTGDEVTEMMIKLCGKLYVWYNETKEYYLPLINMYDTQFDNLLRGIKTLSTNRFNDTPQNEIIGELDVEDLKHLSNVSRLESETDGETMINRLDDIKNKLVNLYSLWANTLTKYVVGD